MSNYTRGFNLDQFREFIGSRKFQPPNSYVVTFTQPSLMGGKTLITYPESIIFPEQHIETVVDNTWGTPRKLPFKSTYGELLITYIIMSDWAERQYFEDWFDWIVPHSLTGTRSCGFAGAGQSQIISDPAATYEDSIGACYIQMILADKESIAKTYYTQEIYPITLTPMSFSSDATGYATFQVLFHVRNLWNNTSKL